MRTRNTSRLIVLDESDQLLMFQYEDHSIFNPSDPFFGPFWVMPGGGLEANESFEEAALRELWEETGIQQCDLSRCVWTRDIQLNWRGELIEHHERFFVARIERSEIRFDNMDDDELSALQNHRWWALHEIESSEEVIVPYGLSELLNPILRNELPIDVVKLMR